MSPHATCETQPTAAELMARLITCAAVLDLRAEKAAGAYRPYFADRASQCRKWSPICGKGAGMRISRPDWPNSRRWRFRRGRNVKGAPFRKTPFSIELA